MPISVIIPALNEARRLPALMARLRSEPVKHEIIVVDGESTDETSKIARDCGARVLETPPGRGRQIREGAAAAEGDILLFLHADTLFPPGGLVAVEDALARNPDAVGGNFRLLFDGGDGFSKWLNGFYAWIRGHGFYYGDSGVFVRRDAYDALGGVRAIALMEDHDFNRRMERHGRTLCIEAPPLVSSSRRFRGRRPTAIVIGWLVIHGLFYLGVPADRLADLYDAGRRRQRR